MSLTDTLDLKRPYRLYVTRPEDIGEGERHYLVTPDYCLLYTQNPPPERSAEVESLAQLPPEAWEWLRERVEVIRAEYIKARERELLERAAEFTGLFGSELAREREKLRRGGEKGHERERR